MLRDTCRVAVALLGMVLAAAPVSAPAQQLDPNRIIDFHVNLEEYNQSVGGSVNEGGRYTITIRGRGAYAITAVVTDVAAQRVTVTVLGASDGSQDFRPLETVRATVGKPAPLKSIPQASVVVEGIRRANVARGVAPLNIEFASTSPRAALPLMPAAALNRCCVTCGEVEVCGCAVTMDCGNCCSGPCCPPIKITASDPNAALPARSGYRFASTTCRKAVPDSERLFTRPEPVGKVSLR